MKPRKKTITRQLLDDARNYFNSKYENDETKRAFVKNYKKFIDYCRSVHDAKNKDDCKNFIQSYADHLINNSYTASTIHSYLSPVVLYHGMSLNDVKKPKRTTAHYKRGRSDNGKKQRSDNDINNPKFAKSVTLQRCLGLRRSELMRLRGGDLRYDESGKPCVYTKGKGGKVQYQRILPMDLELVRSYFEGKATGKLIFAPDEFKNKIDYHRLRSDQAKRAYNYYLEKCKTGEGREQLEEEVRLRYEKTKINSKTGKPMLLKENLTGYYYLRGENKKMAIENGLPLRYDRLCLMAVSEFHLAHHRLDVTVESYLNVK
ncbi:MAG: hypothetical protein IKT56_05715 [Clostridia bacterium]|nr:hypothetical protein [Clostridia bacterium]